VNFLTIGIPDTASVFPLLKLAPEIITEILRIYIKSRINNGSLAVLDLRGPPPKSTYGSRSTEPEDYSGNHGHSGNVLVSRYLYQIGAPILNESLVGLTLHIDSSYFEKFPNTILENCPRLRLWISGEPPHAATLKCLEKCTGLKSLRVDFCEDHKKTRRIFAGRIRGVTFEKPTILKEIIAYTPTNRGWEYATAFERLLGKDKSYPVPWPGW
jgi:hypothetical protein